MMHTGALLCERSIAGLEPLGAFNQPVHRIFAQIRVALLNELGPACADYFSRPDVKRDGSLIGWFAQLPGEPRRWVDLTPEEQADLDPARQDVRRQLDEYVARLAATPDNSSSSNFGKVLAQAMHVPSPDCLYFMNRQPVVAFWGFKNAGVPVGIEPLRLPVQRIAMSGPMPVANELPRVGAPPTVLLRRRWGRWLLGALLLTMLLGAAWWWLHRGEPVHVPGTPLPTAGRTALLREPPADRVGTMVGPSGGASVAVPSGVGVAPGLSKASVGDQKNRPAPSGNVPPPNGAAADATPPEAPQLPTLPAQEGAPDTGKALVIPPGAKPGAAGFMEGIWRSRSGLQLNGRPAEEYYRFDHNGTGDVTVRNGAAGTHCHGTANAQVGHDGRLTIKEPAVLQCSDGSVLPGAVTECSSGVGETVCGGTNQSDGSRFNVRMVGVSP